MQIGPIETCEPGQPNSWTPGADLGSTDVPVAGRMLAAQAYPNPFNPGTTISFMLDRDMWIEIGVYSLTGRQVTILANRNFTAGPHSLTWNGRDAQGRAISSGPYLVRLETESSVEAMKVMLLR